MPYQIACLEEALRRDEKGNYVYSTIIWSDIKKSAKSTIGAAVNLYRAHTTDWGEFFVIANDLKQADSRVAYYLRRAVTLNPDLKDLYRTRGYRITAPSNSYVEAIPIDPSGEAGSNADMLTFSELWGAHEEAKERMWAEMTLSPTKHGQSFRWVESYAGFTEESDLLYNLYDLGVKQGEMVWPDTGFHTNFEGDQPIELYANRRARMLCLWNTKPRCPWQTQEYYDAEAAILSPSQFQRMHRNQWVSSEETFVPIEWWYACKRDEIPPLGRDEPVIVAMDAAVSDDHFGLIMISRHPDRKNHAEEVVVRYAQRWRPPTNGKLDFMGTKENPGPELELRRLISMYNVIEVAYDPHQLHDMATRIGKEGVVWMRSFPQGNDRLEADSMLRDKIRDRRIHHDGNPDLEEHIKHANAKVDEEDRKIRIVKRTQKLKIDLAVCASMATYECIRLNL